MVCLVMVDGKLSTVVQDDLAAQQACFDAVKKHDAKTAEVHRVSTVPSFRWTAEQQQNLDRAAKTAQV